MEKMFQAIVRLVFVIKKLTQYDDSDPQPLKPNP